jgi:chromosome partitioning protein
MRVLALASHKGGAGKTVLATHLAIAASRAGEGPIALIDLDSQGGLADWWDARQEDDLTFAETHAARLALDLDRLRKHGFQLVILDTPPANPMIAQAAIQQADLTVIPYRPSPLDVRAVGITIGLAELVGKPLAFVMNEDLQPSQLGLQIGEALAQYGAASLPGLPQIAGLGDLMKQGQTILDVAPHGDAAQAIIGIWDSLSQRLDRNFRRTAFGTHVAGATPFFQRQAAMPFGRRVLNDQP